MDAVVAPDGHRRRADRRSGLAERTLPNSGSTKEDTAPLPQIAVGLGECGTHAVVAAELGTIYDGERKLARALLGFIESNMLVIADRGYYAFDLWQQFMVTGVPACCGGCRPGSSCTCGCPKLGAPHATC